MRETRHINPFIVAGKIPPQYFCDRHEESSRLVRYVTNGNNVVLISPRRMGKTGLIQYCYDLPEISGSYVTFYLDILQTSSLKEFTFLLGREIFIRLSSYGEKALKQFAAMLRSIAGSFGFDPISGNPTFDLQMGDISDPKITLDEIFTYLLNSKTPSIVAIDEFQQITTYKEKNVEALLRSYIQQLTDTNFIFAGSERHMLQQMFSDSARPFYNSASFLGLKAIDLQEYKDFAIRLFAERDKLIVKEAIEKVYEAFDGNTFYIQKTMNISFSMTPLNGKCTQAITDLAIHEMLASYDTIYREILSQINEPQKQLLVAIAREKEAAGITSASFVRKYALASASSVQAAARRLLAAGLITRSAACSSGARRLCDTYSLQDPLLRLWLLETY